MVKLQILGALLLCVADVGLAQSSQAQARYVDMPLDHFGNNGSRTFKNRYYMNDTFYKPGGPVFFYDAGEASASLTTSSLGRGATYDLARRFNGVMVIWEHRYYGTSRPQQGYASSLSPSAAASYYRYHTVEQALEDVAVFAKNFSISGRSQDFRPNATPWVFIGGSYPGNRAVWSRLRNPEVIYAALSSSAPVQAQTDFWQYFVAVERALAETSGYAGCAADLHAVVGWMENVYTTKQVSAAENFISDATYEIYSDRYASSRNTTDTWYNRAVLMDTISSTPFGDFQYRGLAGRLNTFCSNLVSQKYNNNTITSVTDLRAKGIVATFGLEYAIGVYAKVASAMLVATRSSYGDDSADADPGASSIDRIHLHNINTVSDDAMPRILQADILKAKREGLLDRRTSSPSRRILNKLLRRQSSRGYTYITDQTSWTFQTCSEVGYFQTGNSARSTNLVPGFLDVPYTIETYCTSDFGSRYSAGPNIDVVNAKYAGWNFNVTNVFNSAGQYDPWRALSFASNVSSTIPGRRISDTIPSAGQVPANGEIFGHVIQQGLHCSDLSYTVLRQNELAKNNTSAAGDPYFGAIPDASFAHELFASALSAWLPSFTSSEARATTVLTATPTVSPTATSVLPSESSAAGTGGSSGTATRSATTSSSTGAAPTEAVRWTGKGVAVVAGLAALVI